VNGETMPRNPLRAAPVGRRTGLTAARVAVPLAAGAAIAALAAAERDPVAAAEGGYLALLAAAALLPAGALAPEPARELGLGAVLVAAAAWALPPGPARGAAVAAVLVATLAIAAFRCLARISYRDGASSPLPDLPFAVALPLAVGLQVLLRGDLLLAPDVRTLVVLVGLPLIGAAALVRLARRWGGGVALVAGASALLLGPGWNVQATAALAALATGDLLADPPPALRAGRWRWVGRAAALAVLLAPLAWQQRSGLLVALAGLTLWKPALGAAGAFAAALAAAFLPLPPGEAAIFPWYLWLPLLLPGLALPDPARWRELLAGVLLACASRAVPGEAALAPAVALAALALRRDGAPAAVQAAWTGTLVAGTALLAAFPWLRERPVADLVALLGPGPLVAAVAVALAGLLGAGLPWLARRWLEPGREPGPEPGLRPDPRPDSRLAGSPGARARRRLAGLQPAAALALVGLVALIVLLRLPAAGQPLLTGDPAILIDAARPSRDLPLAGRPVAGLAFTTSLLNASGLPAGTTVATVHLRDGAGEVSWPLRAGEETGEWAARRPDVRAAGAAAPPAWICFVAGDFFGQRYRSRLELPRPRPFSRVAIERSPDLPPDVVLALHEVRIVEAGR
jgi:hypothetical protein